jgi:hypothetical protein
MSDYLRSEINRIHIEEMIARAEAYRLSHPGTSAETDAIASQSVLFVYRKALAAVALSASILMAVAAAV